MGSAWAEYPDKPIRLIVPFPAGGAVDITARAVTARMADDLKTSFVIENRGGAGGVIATDAVAKAAPDGYTLLLTAPNHTINAALQAKLPFDTERDLAPVALVAEVPEVLVSHAGAPFSDFAGFVAYAKANPGKLNYSSAGNGTLPHVTMELLLRRLGLQVAHIPYRGAAPAMTDLLAGQVQLKLDTYATSNQHVVAGKLRAARLCRRETLGADAGPADRRRARPARLRGRAVDRANGAGRHAEAGDREARRRRETRGRLDGVAERLRRDGIEPAGSTTEEFAALIPREIAQWRELAKAANIKLD